jgi:hypothetical protein
MQGFPDLCGTAFCGWATGRISDGGNMGDLSDDLCYVCRPASLAGGPMLGAAGGEESVANRTSIGILSVSVWWSTRLNAHPAKAKSIA